MWWLRQFLRIVKPLSVIFILLVYAFQYLSQDIREIETVSTRSSEYKWRKGKKDVGNHANLSGLLLSVNLKSQIQAMTNSIHRTIEEAYLDLDLITKMSPSYGQMTSLLDTAQSQSQASAFTFHHNAILSAKDLKHWKTSPAVLTDSSGDISSDAVALWSQYQSVVNDIESAHKHLIQFQTSHNTFTQLTHQILFNFTTEKMALRFWNHKKHLKDFSNRPLVIRDYLLRSWVNQLRTLDEEGLPIPVPFLGTFPYRFTNIANLFDRLGERIHQRSFGMREHPWMVERTLYDLNRILTIIEANNMHDQSLLDQALMLYQRYLSTTNKCRLVKNQDECHQIYWNGESIQVDIKEANRLLVKITRPPPMEFYHHLSEDELSETWLADVFRQILNGSIVIARHILLKLFADYAWNLL